MSAAPRLFLVFLIAAAMPFLAAWAVIAVTIGVFAAVSVAPRDLRAAVGRAVWRIRWLLVAVSVLFLAFTPGPMDWVELAARIAVLVTIVAVVAGALHGLGAAALADGLAILLAPFGKLGLSTDVFARRLVLTLDSVPRIQELVAATPGEDHAGPVDRLASRASAVIIAIESDSASR